MNYSPQVILVSTGIIFLMYIASGFLYYFSTVGCLREFNGLKKYYRKHWYIVPLLPLFNLLVFFIRFAGVINSINTDSAWKTRTLTDERKDFTREFMAEARKPMNLLQRARKAVNYE